MTITPALARVYFGLQAMAGAAWWIVVPLSPPIRSATLGELPVDLIALADIPLFVVGSMIAALGIRWAVWVVAPWTMLVAVAMAIHATITTSAGWGALLMLVAAVASVGAGIVILHGRAPIEWITSGPFAFRPARQSGTRRLLFLTGGQTLFFWGLFLVVLPALITVIEHRWVLHVELPAALRIGGGVLLLAATSLGVWSAISMSVRGQGTPLPSAMPRRLVIAGPYRFVRNPMAVAGIAQGVAIGMLFSSWLVITYALCGSLIWNFLVRPQEETDLAARFGAEFDAYRDRVPCWVPSVPRRATRMAPPSR